MSLNSNSRLLAITTLANLCAGKDRDIVKLIDVGAVSAME